MREQFAVTTTNEADYSVVKVDNRWDVHCNGLPVEGLRFRRTKREAVAEVAKEITGRAYRTRIMAEDETGHIWTAEESKQIADYATRLIANEETGGFWKSSTQDAGRKVHYDDLVTLKSHYNSLSGWNELSGENWKQGDWSILVCANLRRTRAARFEAYKLAGLDLDNGYVKMTATGKTDASKVHTFDYQDVARAEHARDEIMARILRKEDGQDYTFTIEHVSVSWPFACKFASK